MEEVWSIIGGTDGTSTRQAGTTNGRTDAERPPFHVCSHGEPGSEKHYTVSRGGNGGQYDNDNEAGYAIDADMQGSKNKMRISHFDHGQNFCYNVVNGMVSKRCLLLWIYIYTDYGSAIYAWLKSPLKRSGRYIHETLTSNEIKAAEEEFRETRTTTNSKVAYLLRELSAFGIWAAHV